MDPGRHCSGVWETPTAFLSIQVITQCQICKPMFHFSKLFFSFLENIRTFKEETKTTHNLTKLNIRHSSPHPPKKGTKEVDISLKNTHALFEKLMNSHQD